MTKSKDEQMIDAVSAVASALQRLGNADAGTPFGGLEALGMAIKDSAAEIATALHDVANAIREKREGEE